MKKIELTDRQIQVLLDALEYYTGDMEAEDEEDDVATCDQLVEMLRGKTTPVLRLKDVWYDTLGATEVHNAWDELEYFSRADEHSVVTEELERLGDYEVVRMWSHWDTLRIEITEPTEVED